MARSVSFGGGLTEAVEPRYMRQRAMANALMQQSQGPISGWGEGVANLARTAAAGFINNRADTAQKTAAQARAEALQRAAASGNRDEALRILSESGDTELQGLGANYQMAALLDPQAVENAKAWDPNANGGKGAMVYVPETQATGMMAEAPTVPELKAAPTRTRDVNGMTIQEEMQPDGTWQQIGARPTFAPTQGPVSWSDIKDDKGNIIGQRSSTGQVNYFSKYPGQGADPLKAGDLPEALKFYTDKAKPYIDAAYETRRQGSTIETALARGDGTGDIAGITAFNKLLDPGAVVREADVSLTLAAQGLADQLAVWMKNKQEGDILPPELRTRMAEMSQAIVDTNMRFTQERIAGFRAPAEQYGVNWEHILSPDVEAQLFPAAPVDLGTGSASSGGNRMGPDDRGVVIDGITIRKKGG